MRTFRTCCSENKTLPCALLLASLLIAAALFSLCAGASGVSLWAGLADALSGVESPAARILIHIRLPRTLAAMLSGAALAASGVLIQGVLGNPLAGPNIIGVNAGAGFCTLLLSCLFPTAMALLPAAAFLGALGTSLLILFLADRVGASRMTVVLAGVAVSSILSAGTDLITTLDPDATLGMSAFMIGGFAGVSTARLTSAACYILPALAASLVLAGDLDILGLGDEVAQSLGLRVRRMRVLLLALASLLAGAAVSFSGLLGFVGLVVPHAVRRFTGGEHRALLPLSMLGGALFVLVCDIVARTAFAPYELPVGILLSLLGGPFFLLLLLKNHRGGRS
ncbi:MAG: iron ABC transporter permease [Clostridia bacterium]|nr:iron ABC transporter permease [Clostridia bacterium]